MHCDKNCGCQIFHQETLDKVATRMPNSADIKRISQLLKVLSDENRIRILEAVFEDELCVCDLGVLLNVTKSAISHQMKLLKSYNLVKSRKEGKMVYYHIYNDQVKTFIQSAFNHLKNIS